MSGKQQIKSCGHVLITGGSGFLGHNLVQLLTSRKACTKITVLDLKAPAEPIPGVDYRQGDITNYDDMLALFRKTAPDAVIHTASPNFHLNNDILYKVNVEGTKTLLRAAQETNVKAFLYTSSASVIHDTKSDLIFADETYPLVMGKNQPVFYTTTKAQAETHVLAANKSPAHPKFLTAAVRPSGMLGVGDVQYMPPVLGAYFSGKTRVQLGANDNLCDFTEITNVAHAHHLALAALLATRERLDAGQAAPLDHEKVDGEAFIITNDSPVYFWDLSRTCWAAAGDKTKPSQVWVLSAELGLFFVSLIEWIYFIFRLGQPGVIRSQAVYSTLARYFNIDKAKTRLGYKPIVSLADAVPRAVNDALYRGVVVGQPPGLKGNLKLKAKSM